MATPKQLVEKAAEITGVSLATVIVHDRNLSNNALRTVAGRGRAAAKVTAEDAANLLIAIAASESVKDSAATVLKYRKLIAVHDSKCGISSYDRLAHGHTFGDALTSLILAASTGEITYAEDLKMKVVFRNPRVTARIEWSIDGHAESWNGYDVKPVFPIRRVHETAGDLERQSSVTASTICFLGATVGDLL